MTPLPSNNPVHMLDIVPRRLLIVEDHESSAKVLQSLLQRHGHQVQTSLNLQDAVEVVQREEIDVVICDLELPDGDGCDLFTALRNHRPVRGIVLSGHGTPADHARSRSAGFDAHLVKPFDVNEIEVTLAQMFSPVV